MRNYKEASKHNWGNDPCGAHTADTNKVEYLSKEYFDLLDKKRIEAEPWMPEEFDKMGINGKKVLEIGYGMGRDHLQLARRVGGGGRTVWH